MSDQVTAPVMPTITNFVRGTTAADPSWWYNQAHGLGPMLLIAVLIMAGCIVALVRS